MMGWVDHITNTLFCDLYFRPSKDHHRESCPATVTTGKGWWQGRKKIIRARRKTQLRGHEFRVNPEPLFTVSSLFPLGALFVTAVTTIGFNRCPPLPAEPTIFAPDCLRRRRLLL